MPELPEVETTRLGIEPHLLDHRISKVIIREPRLRWPVSEAFNQIKDWRISAVERRGKYLLLKTDQACIIIHLGMSGSLRLVDADVAVEKHDHIDLILSTNKVLRYRDPRRFGAFLLTHKEPLKHPRLAQLGPEPLSSNFSAEYCQQRARKRQQAIKVFIMNSQVVVGVGNIYACEALFKAGIHPRTACGKLSLARWQVLVEAIKQVLSAAIEQGGTTLRDFTRSDGQPGYFTQSLNVYGRQGEACPQCQRAILKITQAQRSSFYCGKCQH